MPRSARAILAAAIAISDVAIEGSAMCRSLDVRAFSNPRIVGSFDHLQKVVRWLRFLSGMCRYPKH